jgi:hypothetical protein
VAALHARGARHVVHVQANAALPGGEDARGERESDEVGADVVSAGGNTFRRGVLELREERPEWRTLTRKQLAPALEEHGWPPRDGKYAIAPAEETRPRAIRRSRRVNIKAN